ncbi:2-dehydropantoate 2-reductase [Mariprofundus ferrooxydans]|nr:2-dehydropantoate 2-reductase [Mariprofundus ferrooxydans]
MILLCCKTTQLDDMCQSLLAVVKPAVTCLTLQNGVQAADQVSTYFPSHCVLAASVFIGVRIEKAGHVIHSAAGHIRLGEWFKCEEQADNEILKHLQEAWQKAGVDAKVEKDMHTIVWQKMLWNCGFNAVTALTQRYARDVALHDDMAAWVRAAMLEVIAVASAMNVELDKAMLEKHMRMTCEAGEVKSSMWQDMSHKKPTEIAAMNGYIAGQSKKFGIAVPINTMLANMIDLAEGAYLVR